MYKMVDGGIEIKKIIRMNLALQYWNFATTINTFYSANKSLALVLKLEIISANTLEGSFNVSLLIVYIVLSPLS
jgi:hypothetical protein